MNTSEQNIATVKQAYADFAAGNVEGIANVCTDDITWDSYRHPEIPFAKQYNGRQGVFDFFTILASNVDYKSFEPREFFSAADAVVVRGFHEGVARPTGKTFAHDWMMHFKFREGKVYDYFVFFDTHDEEQAFAK